MPIRTPDLFGFRAAREAARLRDVIRTLSIESEAKNRQIERWRHVAESWKSWSDQATADHGRAVAALEAERDHLARTLDAARSVLIVDAGASAEDLAGV